MNIVKVSVPNTVEYVSNWAFDNTTWYNNQSNGMVYVGKCAYKYKGKIPASVTIKRVQKAFQYKHFMMDMRVIMVIQDSRVATIMKKFCKSEKYIYTGWIKIHRKWCICKLL